MLCQVNGPLNELNKELNQKVVKDLNILTWQDLSIGITLENQFVFKSNWPKCLDVELVKRKGYCPITNRRHEDLINFGELLAQLDWVGNFPITLFKLTKICQRNLPNKVNTYLFEDGPIEALSLKSLGILNALYRSFEINKLPNSWMIRSIKKSLKNPFIQAITNAYFNNIPLPIEFRGAW